jgi:hypothetical protein
MNYSDRIGLLVCSEVVSYESRYGLRSVTIGTNLPCQKFLTEIFKIITRKKALNGLPIYWTIRGSTPVGENVFS